MRIAWVVPGFQGRVDEPGIPALTALAMALSERHDLLVFSVRFPKRAERHHLGPLRVRSFGHEDGVTPLGRRLASARRWVQVPRAIAEAHHQAPFDVIHGWWATESGMLAALAGRMLGVPPLVSLAGGELAGVCGAGYGSQLRAAERAQVWLTLHLATAIGVPSFDTRARLLARAPWLRTRLRDLPLGYDPAIFAPLAEAAARDPTGPIVCVASWTPVKGHALLLDAMRLLVDRGLRPRLVLVGERTDGAEARAAVTSRGLEPYVSLLGARPQAELAALLAGAGVAVIGSWHEAQCLAVVEALACGVPVVATPVGIARELLVDPRIGVCIPVRSPALLADALHARLQRDRYEEPRARQARQAAVAHLALPLTAERFVTEYRRLAGIRGTPMLTLP